MKPSEITQLRKGNKNNIYKYILRNEQCSKNDIAFSLNLSLPTVSKNLNELIESGLVRSAGTFDSTGGRKATIYESISDARVAIGVQILTDDVSIVECGLHGEVISLKTIDIAFEDTRDYYEAVGKAVQKFIIDTRKRDAILGVTITVQGIVDETHQNLIYGRIMKDSRITASHFSQYIDYPCILMHDSEAAAFAESYFSPGINDAVYIFLNKNLGSSFIMNGKVYSGNHSRGAVIEHMCIVPQGRLCYCGKHGCAECYCSANSLIESAGSDLSSFFERLRSNDEKASAAWTDYLHRLTNTIYNVLMFQDVDIVIGGLIRNYMIPEDLERLYQMLTEKSDFPVHKNSIVFEKNMKASAAVGAALYHISKFLEQYD